MLDLKFSAKAKPTAIESRQRPPMVIFIESLDIQLKAIEKAMKGDELILDKTRYGDEGNRRVKKDIKVKVRPWWWQDGSTYNLTLKYGSQTVRISDHPSIICGSTLDDVAATLEKLHEAALSEEPEIVSAVEMAKEKSKRKKPQ